MKQSIVISLIFFTIGLQASDRINLKTESKKTNRLIQTNAQDLSKTEKLEVKELLLEIQDIIFGYSTPSHDRQACTDQLYKLYYISYSSVNSMDKATAACKKFVNLNIFNFAYEKAYISLSSGNAVELALNYSKENSIGKLEIIKYLYSKYYISLSSSNSLKKAGSAMGKVSSDSLDCVKSAYTKYYRSLNSSNAMDKAIVACE